ncbi:MAG TPA: tetratricopeptide repeat protein [Lacipirellulaceae bacterium]|nr:tetratricopeptide repeat protein [Lacipirellulaceae bacterium]
MSDHSPKSDAPNAEAANVGRFVSYVMRLMHFLSALRTWTTGHWLRSVVVAVSLLSLIGVTIGGWAYLASVAIRAGGPNVDAAMKEFDEGRYEEARASVGRMLTDGRLSRSDYGGPLLVLGAIKTKDAESQQTAERRRVEYLIASRYLTEARAYGMPENREDCGEFLLGKSLIESGQPDEGIRVLNELTSHDIADSALAIEAQQLLFDTCLLMPRPRLEDALRHNDLLLANKKLSDAQRADALLDRAECLSRLGRFEESRKAVASVPVAAGRAALVALVAGRVLLDEVEASLQKLSPPDRPKALGQYAGKLATAIHDLQKASTLDERKKQLADRSSYQLARALQLRGSTEEALKQYARTRQLYGDTYEGLAASLGEADLLCQKGEYDAALVGYRRVLEAYAAIPIYRSHVLPVAQLRDRMMAALADLQKHQQFKSALELIERIPPLFSRAEQLELRGTALEQWGNYLLSKVPDDTLGPDSNRTAGLERFRAAGVAFEDLAQSQFATKTYTDDLWRGAQDYNRGQCFSRTVRLLNEYLQYEPQLRNAQALLLLGQAHLALGHLPQSIDAFEECIEFHPQDGATFQARIDCAKAYWQQAKTARAEQLLRFNIAGSTLKPASPEWKDSLFELGMLLHDEGKHEEAIATLEDAVERYPDDPQRLLAQYLTGESYRRWAKKQLADSKQATTPSEHDKMLHEAVKRLNIALNRFDEVQRTITLKAHDIHSDPLMGTMLRNCYMLEGSVLFDLGRYKEAIEAYSNVSSLYPEEPFVLETFVQIANCWRRLDKHDNARGAVQQAQIVLDRLPKDADFASTTSLNREEWRMLLANMSKW